MSEICLAIGLAKKRKLIQPDFVFILASLLTKKCNLETAACKMAATEDYRVFYYIDTSVLLENIPLVKFIKTTSGTRVVYFP